MPRTKYRAVRTNGYASKAEARFAEQLKLRQKATNGDVFYWLEQVPIKLPGGIKYVADFLVFNYDGTHTYYEVKGFETRVWRMKLALLKEARPEVFNRLEIVKP